MEQCDGLSLDTNSITDPDQQVRTVHPNNIIMSCEFCRDERLVRSRLRHVSHHSNHHNTILLFLPYREDQRVEVRRDNVICQILKDKPWREKVEKRRYQQRCHRYLKTSMLEHVFDAHGEKNNKSDGVKLWIFIKEEINKIRRRFFPPSVREKQRDVCSSRWTSAFIYSHSSFF